MSEITLKTKHRMKRMVLQDYQKQMVTAYQIASRNLPAPIASVILLLYISDFSSCTSASLFSVLEAELEACKFLIIAVNGNYTKTIYHMCISKF